MQPLCVSSKSGGGFHFFNKCGEALEHHRDIAEVLRDHLSNGRSGNGAVCTCFKRSTDMFRARYAKPQKQWRRAGSAKCSNFGFTGTPIFDQNAAQQKQLQQKDAEIAAHVAEVLWVMGQKDEARRFFEEARKIDADNRSLQRALEKTGA